MSSLTGRLLIAVPRPRDEDDADLFARSVVLVLHHGLDGAQGLILSEPSEVSVAPVLPGWQDVICAPGVLFQGGPVALDTAIGLACAPGHGALDGLNRIFGALCVVDLDASPQGVAVQTSAIRIFAGSCGWDAGQLDTEMRDGWWVRGELEIGDVFDGRPDTLWQRVMSRQPWPQKLMAGFPYDPSLN